MRPSPSHEQAALSKHRGDQREGGPFGRDEVAGGERPLEPGAGVAFVHLEAPRSGARAAGIALPSAALEHDPLPVGDHSGLKSCAPVRVSLRCPLPSAVFLGREDAGRFVAEVRRGYAELAGHHLRAVERGIVAGGTS